MKPEIIETLIESENLICSPCKLTTIVIVIIIVDIKITEGQT